MTSRLHPKSSVPLRLQTLEGRDIPASAGGFTAGGILGEYFNNAELAGEPAFVRRDVRVDFDWQDRAPGGSVSPSFQQVGADNFSVRWTGQILPRFSQTHTFYLTGDDGARLWARPAGGLYEWNLLVDTWDAPTPDATTAEFWMTGGSTYDIRVEYRELEGAAAAKLAWSSPKTPEAVIDPAINLGVNAVTYDYFLYADAAKTGRAEWGDPVDYFGRPRVATDSLGWPLGDAGHVFWSGRDSAKTGGTYLLQFTGQAEVNGMIGRGWFRIGGIDIGRTLPLGTGYDAETNITTAEVVVDGTDFFGLNFVHTFRTPEDAEGSGVTNVQLMRPRTADSEAYYPAGDLFDADLKQAFSRFTTLRYLTANFNPEKEWADRKLPGAMQAAWGDRAAVWENEVMLANETGKDLYITLPVGASAEYITNLALLLKYGSDGVMPYSEAVSDAVFPGLNPNLRVYVEWGNEFWNWSFSQGGWAAEAGRAAVLNGTPDGQIVNFDGQRPGGDFRRWAALRTVEASNIFRSVWGDDAMGEEVRILLEFQYDNQQATAVGTLQFIDRYFNNGDGVEHVSDPHPVSYYIWGAGGAAYFGAENPRGLLTKTRVRGSGFEKVIAGPGGTATPRPVDSSWLFAGDAGLYRNLANVAANTPMNVPGVGRVPSTPNGQQAMYISGTGSASVTVSFPRAGVYAIDFQAAGEIGQDMGNLLEFYLNDRRITPDGPNLVSSPYPWWPGNGNRDAGKFSNYGTIPVEIPAAGSYTFRIVGRGSVDRTAVIDDVRVSSLDAIYKSKLPTGVRAAGQVSAIDLRTQLALQASYVKSYGLNVVSYEGGWSLGGDAAAVPLQSWAKYQDARTGQIMANSINAFHQAGGEMYVVGTFDQWHRDDSPNANLYPLIRGIDARLKVLPALPKSTLVVPGMSPVKFTAAMGLRAQNAAAYAMPGEWVSWTVNVVRAGDYLVTAKADPDGWAAVYADGIEIGNGSSGLAPGGTVWLEAGVHTIRVQSTGGLYLIRAITLDGLDTM